MGNSNSSLDSGGKHRRHGKHHVKTADEIREEEMQKERLKVREQRVQVLARNLAHKLSLYADNPTVADGKQRPNPADAFQDLMVCEANDMKVESYGVELLHALGFVYVQKANQHLGYQEFLGLPGILHSFKEKGHIFSETFGTIRSALDMQASFRELQDAENKQLSAEERARIEGIAASKASIIKRTACYGKTDPNPKFTGNECAVARVKVGD